MAKESKVVSAVANILESNVDARGNDKVLMLIYWSEVDKINLDNFMSGFLDKATTPESITRARRLLQEQGKYLPDNGIINGRKMRERQMKEAVKNGEVI